MTIKMSESISSLAKAYAQFQQEVVNPSNTAKNPQFKSNYAPLDEVINTAKPVLAKYGLSVLQSTGSEGEAIKIVSILMHESGEFIQSDELVLPAYQTKGGGVKEFNAQGAGSAITYGRRYSLSAILGLASEDDDDGNHASGQGYKEASKPSGNNQSVEDKEKKRQEALAKAEARKNASKQESKQEGKDELANEEKNESKAIDKISPAQMKAIENLVKIVSRAKGFDEGEYLSNLVAVHGAPELAELTQEQAKAVISQINSDRNNK